MSATKLPQTTAIQELAHFWDTHDLTDFEDQLEKITEPIFSHRIASPKVERHTAKRKSGPNHPNHAHP